MGKSRHTAHALDPGPQAPLGISHVARTLLEKMLLDTATRKEKDPKSNAFLHPPSLLWVNPFARVSSAGKLVARRATQEATDLADPSSSAPTLALWSISHRVTCQGVRGNSS